MINTPERARVFYWLDRMYEPKRTSTKEACVTELQHRFPGIMRFKLELYLTEYMTGVSMDVEQRVHDKVMEFGAKALSHFTEDEKEYYKKYVEPLLGPTIAKFTEDHQ